MALSNIMIFEVPRYTTSDLEKINVRPSTDLTISQEKLDIDGYHVIYSAEQRNDYNSECTTWRGTNYSNSRLKLVCTILKDENNKYYLSPQLRAVWKNAKYSYYEFHGFYDNCFSGGEKCNHNDIEQKKTENKRIFKFTINDTTSYYYATTDASSTWREDLTAYYVQGGLTFKDYPIDNRRYWERLESTEIQDSASTNGLIPLDVDSNGFVKIDIKMENSIRLQVLSDASNSKSYDYIHPASIAGNGNIFPITITITNLRAYENTQKEPIIEIGAGDKITKDKVQEIINRIKNIYIKKGVSQKFDNITESNAKITSNYFNAVTDFYNQFKTDLNNPNYDNQQYHIINDISAVSTHIRTIEGQSNPSCIGCATACNYECSNDCTSACNSSCWNTCYTTSQ